MIQGLIIGLQFLTRLPLGLELDYNEKNLKWSLFYYPFIGCLLGAISYLPYKLCLNYRPQLAGLIGVLAMVVLTGGLHLDGLADFFDGFLSNRDREKTLEIMKDPRLGAFGLLGLIFYILLKIEFINEFKPGLYDFILASGTARLAGLYCLNFKDYIGESTMGSYLAKAGSKKLFILASLIFILITINYKLWASLILLGGFILVQLISYLSKKKLGGLTGDINGAIVELVELSSLLILGVI